MLTNYFIAAIRAIRRSPWDAILKIFAIAAGVCTSVLHIAFWYSGDFSNFPELLTGILILSMTSFLLIQFFGQPHDSREYKLRIILGDEDIRMRGRKIAEAGLIIFGGVVLGLVCADSYFTYVEGLSIALSKAAYLLSMLVLGFFHFTVFLFTVWFGTSIVIRNNSESFTRFSKVLAGSSIFITSLAAIRWSVAPQELSFVPIIYLVDIVAISFFAFSSWNRLAQHILETKGRILSIMMMQGAPSIKLLFYWVRQIGPAALISIGVSLLVGNIILSLQIPHPKEHLAALITFCWAAFVFVIVVLALSQPISRGFKQETPKSHH